MSDGLGLLDQQRERRARRIPASKNPPRNRPVAVAAPVEQPPVEQPHDPPEVVSPTSRPKAAKPPRSETITTPVEPTVKMSIYLEPTDDLYLEEITHAGKTSRPRVALSRSAIVRLALEQLAVTMTVDQIVTELRGRGIHQGTGRKRR